MQNCKSGDTFVVKRHKFSFNQCHKNVFEGKEMQKIPYASAIESLIYVQVYTHLNIVYIIGCRVDI